MTAHHVPTSETPAPRELTADEVNAIAGAKDHPHWRLSFGPAEIEICGNRGCYSLYNGGEEVSSTCP
jgi:hypothetical protein